MATKRGLKISPELTLPLSAVTSTMLVLGGKGMGKTNLGGVMVEEISAAGLRWSVIDPMGVWWGLRHSADGAGKGIECLILGGVHGDIPIEPTGGAVVADLVADESVNVVIDISRKRNGEMWSIKDRIRFMLDYGKQLYKRQGSTINGRRREPICQLIDEVARFIPQTIRSNEDNVAACAGIWSAIVEEGRNVGIGVVMLTQRNARINKDVAELADVMMAFRTVGPKSLAAVMDWLGEHVTKEALQVIRQEVRSLPVGSCLVVSPGWLKTEGVVPIRMRHTFDSSATPKPGESARRVRGAGAVPDLAAYAERMKDTIERALGDDPTALKKKIRELETRLAKAPAAAPATPVVKTVSREITDREKAAIERPFVKERVRISKQMDALVKTVRDEIENLIGLESDLKDTRSLLLQGLPEEPAALAVLVPERPSVQRPKRPDVPTPRRSDVTTPPVNEEVKLRGRSIEMLRACARMYPKGLTTAQVASQAGMKRNGGGFKDYRSLLKTSGSVRFEGDLWFATEEGLRRLGEGVPETPTTTEAVLEMWMPRMRGKAKDMLRIVVELNGETISRDDLARAVGMDTNGGGFKDYVSLMRTAGLVITDGSGVRANAETLLL